MRNAPPGVTVTSTDIDTDCASCWEGKMTRTPHPPSDSVSSQPFALVHIDLAGPLKPHSFHTRKRYLLVILDDHTHFTWTFGLRNKSDAPDLIQHWIQIIKTQFNRQVKTIRSDRGGEFLNSELSAFYASHGIKQELTADKSPQQNGKAERMHQTLFNKARCMLLRSGLPPSFWLYAVTYAAWIQNRLPSSSCPDVPFSLLTGKPPNLCMAKVFGCLSHIYLHPDNRPSKKLSPHSEWAIFLGVREETKGWEFYLPLSGKVGFVTRNVKFHEAKFLKQWREEMLQSGQPFDPSDVPEPFEYSGDIVEIEPEAEEDDDEDEDAVPPVGSYQGAESPLSLPPFIPFAESGPLDLAVRDSSALQDEPGMSAGPPTPPAAMAPRRSTRTRKAPLVLTPRTKGQSHAYKRPGMTHAVVGTKYDFADPISVKEADASPNAAGWLVARQKELNSFEENKVWMLVPSPPGVRPLGVKWIHKTKLKGDGSFDKHKARLVVQGYAQREGIDYEETFSPTASTTTVRAFLLMACLHDLELHQLDVSTAFLYGTIDKEIYVKQPPGHDDGSGKVYKLLKSVYGLKQAPRIWIATLKKVLSSLGFVQSCMDESLFFLLLDGKTLWLIVFVDDMLLASKHLDLITKVKVHLAKHFKMTDMGEAGHYLGMTITRDRAKRLLTLTQEKYCLELGKRFQVVPNPKVLTPLPKSFETFYIHELSTAPQGGLSYPTGGCPDPFDPLLDASSHKLFQQVVGSLNYISGVTRPDLSFAVGQLSRVMHRPRTRHLKAALHAVTYLANTASFGLHYDGEIGPTLIAYSDSDHQACPSSKSISGLVFMVAGGPLFWQSKRQDRVTNSTCESEAQALISCVQQVEYLRDLLEEMDLAQSGPTQVCCDNKSSVDLATDAVSHHRTKQLRKVMHYVRDRKECGVILPTQVDTTMQYADFLTKNCDAPIFHHCRQLCGIF